MVQFKSSRLDDSTPANQIDNKVNEVEALVQYLFGVAAGEQNIDLTGAPFNVDTAGRLTGIVKFRGAAGTTGIRLRDTTSGTEYLLAVTDGALSVYQNTGTEESPSWTVVNELDLTTGGWVVVPDDIVDLTATAGQVLTADGEGGAAFADPVLGEQVQAADIDSEAATDGYILTADGAGNAAWEAAPTTGLTEVQAADVDSETAADGYVLTADGAGGAAWEVPSGGVDMISCRAFTGADYSLSSSSSTSAIPLDSESWDTAAMHDLVTNTSRLTIPASAPSYAIYAISGQAQLLAGLGGATEGMVVELRRNGSIIATERRIGGETDGTYGPIIALATTYRLQPNDYIELYVSQNSGSAADVSASLTVSLIGGI